MATDLDPLFVKALKLLHSRSHDALDQLKQMTDEAISLRRGEMALKKMEDDGKDSKTLPNLYKSGLKREHSEFEKKRESEKRSLEKLKEDLVLMTDDHVQTKKLKLDPESKQNTTQGKDGGKERERSRDSSKDAQRERREEKRPTLKEDPSWLDFTNPKQKQLEPPEKKAQGGRVVESESSEEESSFPGLDAEQFADMMDLACVVCKQIDITSGNRLLDCQECHRLYHQECHRPPVSEDVDDPRFVWYCSKCSKNMKKMVKAQKPKSAQSSSSKEKETARETTKAFKSESSVQTPFRRIDTSKSSGGSKESNSRPYTGLASLAANLSSKTHESSKSSRTSESSTKSSGSSKVDHTKGLGFLFKPDAHKITNLKPDSQKTSSLASQKSGSVEKAGLFKMSSSSSGTKSSSGQKGYSPLTSKPAGISLLAKSTTSSTSSTTKSSLGSTSTSTKNTSSSGSSKSLSTSSMMNADKKLQMMKKKAAARAAEKKSFR